jgi:hypothetical protein
MQNDQVEQLAANNLTIPQDAIASLLQRLVSPTWSRLAQLKILALLSLLIRRRRGLGRTIRDKRGNITPFLHSEDMNPADVLAESGRMNLKSALKPHDCSNWIL